MSGQANETDKEILKRVMSEPTFEAVKKAMLRENAKRKEEISHALSKAQSPTPSNETRHGGV